MVIRIMTWLSWSDHDLNDQHLNKKCQYDQNPPGTKSWSGALWGRERARSLCVAWSWTLYKDDHDDNEKDHHNDDWDGCDHHFERSVMVIVVMMIVTGNVGPTSPYFSKLKNNISFTCASDNGWSGILSPAPEFETLKKKSVEIKEKKSNTRRLKS